MRLGICTFVALAFLGCSSNDVPTFTGTTTTAQTDVTGTWTLTWGPMTGTQTVHDTTITPGTPPDTTITNRLVADTCNATGTMTVTQASPIADVTGTYTVTRTCSGFGTILGANPLVKTDSVWKSLVTAGNVFYFFLDSATFKQGQQATVNGNTMTGVGVWTNLRFAHAPKDTAHVAVPLTGTFSATKQ